LNTSLRTGMAIAIFSLPVLAHASTFVGSASAQLYQLQYAVLDLTPNDNNVAAIAIEGSGFLTSSANWQALSGGVNPLPTSTLSVQSAPTVSASVSGTQISLSASMLVPVNQGSGAGALYHYGPAGTQPAVSDAARFHLSPYTSLTITGLASALASTQVAAFTFAGSSPMLGYSRAEVSGGFVLSPDGGGSTPGGVSVSSWSEVLVADDLANPAWPNAVSQSFVDKPFVIQVVNNSASAIVGDLNLKLSVGVSARPPVPEPGTWALMGLGLVGLHLVTRRRPGH